MPRNKTPSQIVDRSGVQPLAGVEAVTASLEHFPALPGRVSSPPLLALTQSWATAPIEDRINIPSQIVGLIPEPDGQPQQKGAHRDQEDHVMDSATDIDDNTVDLPKESADTGGYQPAEVTEVPDGETTGTHKHKLWGTYARATTRGERPLPGVSESLSDDEDSEGE